MVNINVNMNVTESEVFVKRLVFGKRQPHKFHSGEFLGRQPETTYV